MGLFDSIGDLFGEQTGFGGNGNPDPHNLNDAAYEDYYNKAVAGLNDVGKTGQMGAIRSGLEGSINSQLANLDNNAAGRKQNFLEDSARSFSADAQNRARAAGGTGNLAQTLSMPGSAYDSEARGVGRGLNDLNSKSIQDIGSLTGSQNVLNSQDLSKQGTLANLAMQRIGQRTGIASQNAENSFNSDQAGAAKRGGTLSSIGSLFGGMFAEGGRVAAYGMPNANGEGGGGIFGGKDLGGSGLMKKLKEAMNGGGGGMSSGGGPESLMGGGAGDAAGGAGAAGGMDLSSLAMMAAARGGRAMVPGDSYKNDKIPAILSEDEVVVPRSITKGKNMEKRAGTFVKKSMGEDKSGLAALAKKRLMSYGGRC